MASLTAEGWESRLEDGATPEKRHRIEYGDGSDKSVSEGGDDGDKSVCDGGDGGEKSVLEGGNDDKITIDGYSSDDEMPDEVFDEYHRQIEKSQCFEVEDFSQYFMFNMVMPVTITDYYQNFITPFAEMAIKQFNEKEDANFEFVRLVNLTSRVLRGINYYITFEAKDADDGQIKTFQTLVVYGIQKVVVEFCRLKPSPIERQGTEHEQAGQGLTCC